MTIGGYAVASLSGDPDAHASDVDTCPFDPQTLRRRGIGFCPVHSQRVTHDSIAWEQIPEQTLCICAHVKGVHRNPRRHAHEFDECAGANGHLFRAIGLALEEASKAVSVGTIPRCCCSGFHDADEVMDWKMFAGRFLPTSRSVKQPTSRERIALQWAWKKSGLDLTADRTWSFWLADSKRVWRAWRAAGSPIEAFGKERSFGLAEIPALEDS